MKKWKELLLFLILSIFVSDCSKKEDLLIQEEAIAPEEVSPRSFESKRSDPIPDQYIVVLKDEAGPPAEVAQNLSARHGFSVGHIYHYALRGFSAQIPEQALNGLSQSPQVQYIEPDLEMFAFAQTIPTGIRRIEANLNAVADIDGNDDARVDVDVAVIDTGIDDDHPDLNVVGGVRFFTSFPFGGGQDSNYNDDNGHGSHVAGTVGAIDDGNGVVGVAPGVRLWAVKVLDSRGSGYLSDIIKGVDWVTERVSTIEVANMSLGGQGSSSAFRTAIQNSVKAGVVHVVAAGNSDADVYGSDGSFGTSDDYIPASYPEAAAISAMVDSDGQPGGTGSSTSYGSDDSFAGFSNFSGQVVSGNPVTSPGKAIDLMLPGVNILSTYRDGQYATASGTSMASPHGAGLAALHIAQNGRATNASGVYAIRQALIDAGVAQNSSQGLASLNDPDGNEEHIGWAGSTGPQDPVADAGEDQTVADSDGTGSEEVTLDGSGSYDPDGGTITDYSWDDGTTTHSGETVLVNLAVGNYPITLTVTDDSGATGTDIVNITVNANQPPTADAGADQTVIDSDGNGFETVTLNGAGSSDPDGTISSYGWDTDNNGSIDKTGPSVDVNYSLGSHTAILTVTDNGGASSSDQVTITVNEAPAGISVTGIDPNSVNAGSSVPVTITGTGFVSGASVSLEKGSGPTPEVLVTSVSSDGTTITATIATKSGGPPRNRLWDVRVTNPDGSSAVLQESFTVTP